MISISDLRKIYRMGEIEVRALEALQHYGFPTVPFHLAATADEAVKATAEA